MRAVAPEFNVVQDSNSSNTFNQTYGYYATNIVGGSRSGNFYGNYAGMDSGSGDIYAISGDGVGDTQVPYMVGSNFDYYPLTTDLGTGHTQCISITEDTSLSANITCDEDEAVFIAAVQHFA